MNKFTPPHTHTHPLPSEKPCTKEAGCYLFQLGEKYFHGLGVRRSDGLAVFYYTEAAKARHQQAQYFLGLLYYYGSSVKQDRNLAVFWLMQATNQHHAPAQYFLGFMYQYGLGVPKNMDKGLRYLTLASDQKYALAQETMMRLNLKFLP